MLLPALQVVCPSPEGDGKLTDYVLPDGAHNTYVNVKNTFKHNKVNQSRTPGQKPTDGNDRELVDACPVRRTQVVREVSEAPFCR